MVQCFCLHCRETWEVPFYAYREPRGISPMKNSTRTGRVRKLLGLSIATVVCFTATSAPRPAQAFVGDLIGMTAGAISSLMGKGRASEGTQVLNNIILGNQLSEDVVHTEKLFAIDEQTMLAVLAQPINTHGMTRTAVSIAREALGSQGIPYEIGAALGTHEQTFMFDPGAVVSQETVMPVVGLFMDSQDQAARESVASIAAQQNAADAAREAVDQAVSLSQGSEGQTQALMAGNQINAATFGKLDSIQTGIQSANYLDARKAAAEQADLRASWVQRNHDTRDFLTGPMPTAGGAAAGATPGFTGM
jgi:hypothetical protein